MKTTIFISALLLVMAIGIGGCKKSTTTPADTNLLTFKATLLGSSETPSVTSTASGTGTFTYNKTTYILSGTVTFAGITPTGAHIHKGAVGTAGGVIFPLTPLTSPISFTSVALDATQQADLMANNYYVNIHSTAYPAGEIRGQLIEQVTTTTGGTYGY
jgi:hypothetical protein